LSDIYTELETNLVAMLAAAPGLEGVKTIEADVRECLFSEAALTGGFGANELPAIQVSAEIRPSKRHSFTASEMELEIPITVVVVTRAQRKKAARESAREMQLAVEKALDQARRSANPLGMNAIVTGEITSTIVVVENKPHRYAIGETQAEVLKIVDL
jgi:hypothetical protein